MEPIPLPSHIHYELLLQLLERQTSFAVNNQNNEVRQQVQQLIITLRKALVQQKQLEQTCERYRLPYDYYWSLNSTVAENNGSSTLPPPQQKRNI